MESIAFMAPFVVDRGEILRRVRFGHGWVVGAWYRSIDATTAKRPLIEPHRRSSARPRREGLLQAQGAWREVAAASPSSSLHVQISH
jgi:hypothetical protein